MEPTVTASRVQRHIRSRFNPLRGVTPMAVTRWLEDYRRGWYRESAYAMQVVADNDYQLQTVKPKRDSAPARLEWEIVANEGAEEQAGEAAVEAQRLFLQDFYNHLIARDAIDRDVRGGLRLIIRQMQQAVGYGKSAHEILWRPQRNGMLRAELWHVPLWFFEGEDGFLRYLPDEGSAHGVELTPGQWMITTGPGLMQASMVCYILKNLPLKDWLTYCGRNGMPAITMATDAAYGSSEWDDAVSMVQAVASEFAGVHSRNSELMVHDLKGSGQPYGELIDKMDRSLSSLWRGGDLSTMSGQDSMGASLQQEETDILLDDDVEMINGVFEHQLTPEALRWKFGPEVQPLVYFRLLTPDRLDEKAELEKVRSLIELGHRVKKEWAAERFGVPLAETADDDILQAPGNPSDMPVQPAANARPAEDLDLIEIDTARREDMAPIVREIEALYSIEDSAELAREIRALRERLADLATASGDKTSRALEEMLAQAAITGAEEIAKKAPQRAFAGSGVSIDAREATNQNATRFRRFAQGS